MLDKIINSNIDSGKIFRMGSNPRTAGSMPIWSDVKSESDKTINKLESINSRANNNIDSFHSTGNNFSVKDNAFGFLDLVDMVNPLQHIPILSDVYRNITGDEIKPISKIIGGGVYAGPLGAGSAIVDIISKEETGNDLLTNVKNLVISGELPSLKSVKKNTLNVMANAGNTIEKFPEFALAFVDLKQMPEQIKKPLHSYNSRYND